MQDMLYVTTRFPIPHRDGVDLPAAECVRRLAGRANLTVAYFDDNEDAQPESHDFRVVKLTSSTSPTRFALPRGIGRFWSLEARREIEALGPFDLTIAHRLHCAFAASRSGTNRTLIMQDLISAKVGQYSTAGNAANAVVAQHYRAVERWALRHYRCAHVVSPDEQTKTLSSHPGHDIRVTPNGVSNDYQPDDGGVTPSDIQLGPGAAYALYYGNLGSRRNQTAVVRAAAIISDLPEDLGARLIVIGGGAPAELAQSLSANPKVDYFGRVANPTAFFEHASFLLNPQPEASGVKNSVLEPMLHGLPCLVTPPIAAGLGAADTVHLLVAETDIELAAKSQQLFATRTDSGAALGARGQTFAKQTFSWDNYVDAIVKI